MENVEQLGAHGHHTVRGKETRSQVGAHDRLDDITTVDEARCRGRHPILCSRFILSRAPASGKIAVMLPKRLVVGGCCRFLENAMYGTREANTCWGNTIVDTLTSANWTRPQVVTKTFRLDAHGCSMRRLSLPRDLPDAERCLQYEGASQDRATGIWRSNCQVKTSWTYNCMDDRGLHMMLQSATRCCPCVATTGNSPSKCDGNARAAESAVQKISSTPALCERRSSW